MSLRGIVETLATDRAAVEALVSPHLSGGVTRSRYYDQWIDSVQEDSRHFLSGGGADIGPVRRPFPRDKSSASGGSRGCPGRQRAGPESYDGPGAAVSPGGVAATTGRASSAVRPVL